MKFWNYILIVNFLMKFGWIQKWCKTVAMRSSLRLFGKNLTHRSQNSDEVQLNLMRWFLGGSFLLLIWVCNWQKYAVITAVLEWNSSYKMRFLVTWGPYQLSSHPETFGYKTIHQFVTRDRMTSPASKLSWLVVTFGCAHMYFPSHRIPIISTTDFVHAPNHPFWHH